MESVDVLTALEKTEWCIAYLERHKLSQLGRAFNMSMREWQVIAEVLREKYREFEDLEQQILGY